MMEDKNVSHSSTGKRQQKLYVEQPVYVKSYTLLKELTSCYSRIPRDIRYTLGSRMLNAMTDEVMNVVHAFKSAYGKKVLIKEALTKLEEVKVMLRLLKDIGAISTKFFLHTLPITTDIASQLTSWARYVERNTPQDKAE